MRWASLLFTARQKEEKEEEDLSLCRLNVFAAT